MIPELSLHFFDCPLEARPSRLSQSQQEQQQHQHQHQHQQLQQRQ
jgi:hypothetical protein